jgi:hypothetical protein
MGTRLRRLCHALALHTPHPPAPRYALLKVTPNGTKRKPQTALTLPHPPPTSRHMPPHMANGLGTARPLHSTL